MRILIACEFSGVVRRAFAARGHRVYSCDLLPSDDNSKYHFQQDVLSLLSDEWDMLIAHPPCTFLTCAQNKWYLPKYADRFPNRREDQIKGIQFFLQFTRTAIPLTAIENPVGVMSTHYRKPDQIIQPYQYGHDVKKTTCLWLKGLPRLLPTRIVPVTYHYTRGGNFMSKWHVNLGSTTDMIKRAKDRSVTFQGIADAMANQWG